MEQQQLDGSIIAPKSKRQKSSSSCKWFFICCGENGIYKFPSSCSEMVVNVQNVNHAIYCCSQLMPKSHNYSCNHVPNDTTAIITLDIPTLKFFTSLDVLAFQICVCPHPMYHNSFSNWPVNFVNVQTLCDYFLIDANICQNFKNRVLLMDFPHGISALTSWIISDPKKRDSSKKQSCTLEQILHESNIDYISRLNYLLPKYKLSIIPSCHISLENVSQALSVEISILALLDASTCVMAGGAVLKLANPSSPFTERCNVDLYVLQTDNQTETLQILLKTLQKSGRTLFRKGYSVFIAIGAFGVRQIQVILSAYKAPHEVIGEFDFSALKAFYDGSLLYSTLAANYDWHTKICTTTNYTSIRPLRLLSMQWKGFKLPNHLLEFLNNEIGFPPRDEIVNKLMYNIPFLLDDTIIPMKVQHHLLHQHFEMTAVTNVETLCLEKKQDLTERKHNLVNYNFYNKSELLNVYSENLTRYASSCCILSSNVSIDAQNFCHRSVSCTQSLQIYDNAEIRKDRFGDICILMSLSRESQICFFKQDLPRQLIASCAAYSNQRIYQYKSHAWPVLFIKPSEDTQIFQDGLLTSFTKVTFNKAFQAKMILHPRNFLEKKSKDITKLKIRWECVEIFLQT